MDRKLNKKELKFLTQLGIGVNENTTFAEIQNIFPRDSNQNIPIVNSEVEENQSHSVENSIALSNSAGDKNQNVQIVTSESANSVENPIATSVNEKNREHSVENQSVVPKVSETDRNHSVGDEVAVSNSGELSTAVSSATHSNTIGSVEVSMAVTSAQTVKHSDSIECTVTPNSASIDTNSSVDTKTSVTIPTSVIQTPIMSTAIQTNASSVDIQSDQSKVCWAKMVEDSEKNSASATKSIDESDFINDSEIKQRIQIEKGKLKEYASQIHRLRNEVAIIEHQREIAILNLSTLEASLIETNSEIEAQATESSVRVEMPTKYSVASRQQVSSVQSRLQVKSFMNRQPASESRRDSQSSVSGSSDNSEVLCFNCSSRGHKSHDCKQPRRVKGSCFKCGSTSHILKDCRSNGDNRGTFRKDYSTRSGD